MKKNNPEHTVQVASLPDKNSVKIGKPSKVITSAMRPKVAFPIGGDTTLGSGGNFYSPELSPDFLELPQSVDEQRNYFRFFYENEPFVHQAVNTHVELPLSKIRLRKPKSKNKKLANASMRFCERWVQKIKLLHRLIEISHDLHLIGEVSIFAEDSSPDMPTEITHETYRELTEEGKLVEELRKRPDARERAVKWIKENYQGWTAIRVLPPENIHMESFSFTDKRLIELIPDTKTKAIVDKAIQGDERAIDIVESMPRDVVEYMSRGENIPLNTDPDAGSFVHFMARKKAGYEARGKSVLQSCLRILVYRDKLRQAQTSIASRHMTPYRVIWADNLNAEQIEDLRDQVDLSLQDPDFSVITNFEINWEERGADQRLLDLSSEYDLTDRQMYAGLGVTESLLSGESSYSGDRINLEVLNVRYLLLRELLQDFVDYQLLAPMCRRMGFIEKDEDGHEVVVHPRLSFTRLALRDNQETFDALFNLYQKGSLDIETILDLLNLDPDTVKEKLQKDLFTLNDSTFNEVLRAVYSRVGDSLAENSNLADKLADMLGLEYKKADESGMSRFASNDRIFEYIKSAVNEAVQEALSSDRFLDPEEQTRVEKKYCY